MKLPIISLAILGGQIAGSWNQGNLAQTLDTFQSLYTGTKFVGGIQFVPQNLAAGYLPWLAKRFLLPLARPRLGGMHLPVSIS